MLPMSGCTGSWGEHGQQRLSRLAKGTFHTAERHTQYRKWGFWVLPEDALGISWQIVSNCIGH